MKTLLLFWCFSAIAMVFGNSTECQAIVNKIEGLIHEVKEHCIDGKTSKKEPELTIRTDADDVNDIVSLVASVFGVKHQEQPTNITANIEATNPTMVTTETTTDDISSTLSEDTTTENYLTTIYTFLTTNNNQITTTEGVLETTTDGITTEHPTTTENMSTIAVPSQEETTIIGNRDSKETTTGMEDVTTVSPSTSATEISLETKDEILGLRQASDEDVNPVTEVANDDDKMEKKSSNILNVMSGLVTTMAEESAKTPGRCREQDEYFIPVLRICGKTKKNSTHRLGFRFYQK